MHSLALLLILASAFVHVIPHAAIKGTADRTAFVWWMLAGTAVLYAPSVFFDGMPSPRAWLFIVASAILEVLYLLAISRAYATGDLSVAYPLARGSAPLFLILFSIFVLREPITFGGISGIVLIAAGVFLVGGGHRVKVQHVLWPIVAGMMTATYTSVDKLGVRLVHPFLYIYLVLILGWIGYTPLILMRNGLAGLRRTFDAKRVFLGALAMPLAYGLVLVAMRMGLLASYAGSVREVSVIVAAGVGAAAFGEKVTPTRVGGAAAILAGVGIIALSG
ncbi:MAG: EamA family transporter [Acidobacteria bacterium]|nr:EamA family transporter [Acidobacteriota bacterium]